MVACMDCGRNTRGKFMKLKQKNRASRLSQSITVVVPVLGRIIQQWTVLCDVSPTMPSIIGSTTTSFTAGPTKTN